MKKILSAAALFFTLSFLAFKYHTPAEPITVKVGGLLSLTGNWSALGVTSQEAMNQAVQAINSRLEQTGSRYRFAVTFYDTQLDTARAQAAIRQAYAEGVRYIIGPQSSAEVAAIRSFANEKGILVVSQGSTAGALALPGDAVFRFCPSDAVQGDAMAQAIYGFGGRALISLTRDDVGNRDLQRAVDEAFLRRGGVVDTLAPWPGTTTDFTPILATLKSKIQQQSKKVGPGKVGVYLTSFDKATDLFRLASKDPVFSSVRWYGGDGVALSSTVLADVASSNFAASARFFAPTLSLPQPTHGDLTRVATAIRTKTGIEADAYTLATYDALWVIARTVTAFPEPPTDFAKVKDIFQQEAAQYYGLTGHTYLNAAGDRATGQFDYWGVVKEGGTYTWKWVGKSL